MLPCFIFGVLVLRHWEIWRIHWIGCGCLLLFLACVLMQGNIGDNGLSFYGMKTTWMAFFADGAALPLYFARIINGIIGSIGVMWAVQAICDKCKVVIRLAEFGTTTLWVYILHQWLLERVVEIGWYNASIWCALMWTGMLFGLSHTFGLMMQRIKSDIWYNMLRR